MKKRRLMLVSVATVGCSWVFVTSASALDLGPVSVPVTLPTVGPVVVEAPPAVAPDLGVTVTVSPETGVAVDVTPPTAIGPITLPAVAPPAVHVAIGAAPVAVPVSVPPLFTAPAPSSAPASATDRVATSSLAPTRKPVAQPAASAAARATANHASARNLQRVGETRSAVVDESSVVNASLRHAAPGGEWNLWREVASARMLWFALLLIALVAHWAVSGFLRDALRRARLNAA